MSDERLNRLLDIKTALTNELGVAVDDPWWWHARR
jgi:hypothetical protein